MYQIFVCNRIHIWCQRNPGMHNTNNLKGFQKNVKFTAIKTLHLQQILNTSSLCMGILRFWWSF